MLMDTLHFAITLNQGYIMFPVNIMKWEDKIEHKNFMLILITELNTVIISLKWSAF